jgi:hypothetical protein
MTAASGVAMAQIAMPSGTEQAVPPPPISFETEVVREFEPSKPQLAEPMASGPGYAPAEPIKIEWPSELVQVESDPEKVQGVEPEQEREPVARPKRVRQPLQAQNEEPLVQIETAAAEAASGGEPKAQETAVPR